MTKSARILARNRQRRGSRCGEQKLRIEECGNVYGSLTVFDFAGQDKFGNAMWTVICACGETFDAPGYVLRQGRTQRCAACRRVVVKFKAQMRGHRTKTTAKWTRDDLIRMQKLLAHL
jgi:hypothetical protein